ncbi:pentapeptide repeat-containing protein [Erwinia amylovora]
MEKLASQKEYFDQSFSKLDLSSSELENTSFEECEFDHCNFTSAKLVRCKFINCTFSHCNLSVAAFPGSSLYAVRFIECKISGVDWTRAHWPSFQPDPELSFSKCILTHASFFGLTLQCVKMDECRVNEVDFRESDLASASITGCDLAGSLFSHTNLRNADLIGSWDFTLDVLNNTVTGAKFSRSEAVFLLESLGIKLAD